MRIVRFSTLATMAAALCLSACATNDENRQRMVDAGELSGVNERGERVRCERVRPTGSRFTERVCLTEAEWTEMERSSRQFQEDGSRSRTDMMDIPSAPEG